MNKLTVILSVLLGIMVSTRAQAFIHVSNPNFVFSYKTVFDTNASQYVISTNNIETLDEGTGAASYWTPTVFAQPAVLIQKFIFTNITTQIALNFEISAGSGYNTGTAEMEASADGINWTILFQGTGTGDTNYSTLLPTNLVGTSALWLRTTLETTGPDNWDPKFAQFSRTSSPQDNPTTPIFLLEATTLQELQTNGFGYSTNSNSASILGYNGSNSSVSIPSQIGALPVTSIGDFAFNSQSGITTVIIPSGVTNIGSSVFSNCANLTSVTIPDSVMVFGTGIFSNSPNVTITGSQSMVSYLAQNASALGFTGDALTSIQNGGAASGVYSWISSWLLSDNSFISRLSTVIHSGTTGVDQTLLTNTSFLNSLATNATFVNALATNPVFLTALAQSLTTTNLSTNYGISSKSVQTVQFPAIPVQTYKSGKTVPLAASSSTKLPITYTIANPSIATIQGNVLRLLGSGSTTVTATQSGNQYINPANATRPLVVH